MCTWWTTTTMTTSMTRPWTRPTTMMMTRSTTSGKMNPMTMAMRMRSTMPATRWAKKMSHRSLMKQVWQLRTPPSTTLTAARRCENLHCPARSILWSPLTWMTTTLVAVDLGSPMGRAATRAVEKENQREKVARVKARAVEKELDTFCPEPEDLSSAEDLHRRTTHRHPRWQGRLQVEALPSMDHGSKDIDFQHLASRKSLTTPTSPQRPHRFLEVSIGMKWSHKNCLWWSNLGQAEWLSQHAWDGSRDHQGPAWLSF